MILNAGMDPYLSAPRFALALFVGMLICLEIGRRVGARRKEADPEPVRSAKAIVEGSFYGLFSLLVAFSFAGATSRYDDRRKLIVEEANDIGTAYLRVDLLPAPDQPAMRDLFRQYTSSRIAVYQKVPDLVAAEAELVRGSELQLQLWQRAVAGSTAAGAHPDAGKLLLPALNSMIDITNTRTWAARTHPPRMIFVLLFLAGLACASLAGQSLAVARPPAWTHMIAFAFITCLGIFMILQIEFPRMGFLRITEYD